MKVLSWKTNESLSTVLHCWGIGGSALFDWFAGGFFKDSSMACFNYQGLPVLLEQLYLQAYKVSTYKPQQVKVDSGLT